LELTLYAQRKAKDPKQPDSVAFSPTIFVAGLAAFWITYLLIASR
jgi:hypothetical protein